MPAVAFLLVGPSGDLYPPAPDTKLAACRHLVAWDAQMNPLPAVVETNGLLPVVLLKRAWQSIRVRSLSN